MGCRVFIKEYDIKSRNRFDVINITHLVEDAVKESKIANGFVLVFAPHATAAIAINEYEPRIIEDYISWVRKVIPPSAGWKHDEIDDNAHAHIASLVIGQSKVLPLSGGKLVRGTWQEVLLLEFDGPRRRTLVVQVYGL